MMRRGVVSIAAAVLAAAIVVLWVRSHSVREEFFATVADWHLCARSYLGGAHLMVIREYPYGSALECRSSSLRKEREAMGQQPRWDDQYPAPMGKGRIMGFGYASGYYNLNPEDNGLPWMPYFAIVLPYWALILLFVSLLVFWGVRSVCQLRHETR